MKIQDLFLKNRFTKYWGHCCGSMTFWCGSGSADPCLWLMDPDWDPSMFIIDLQDGKKKINFLKKYSCILLFEGTFTSFFKDKKSKRSNKLVRYRTVEIKVFLLHLLNDRRIRIRIQEAQKHVDPDPDPQHLKDCLHFGFSSSEKVYLHSDSSRRWKLFFFE
jgi:hypothetical protein